MDIDPREQRGLAIVKVGAAKIREVVDGKYLVPSQTKTAGSYFVDVSAGLCSCPDYEETRRRCKHLWAVLFLRKEVTAPESAVAEPKKKYPRDWSAYYAAKHDEKPRIQALLRALCDCIVQPPYKGNGRPALPLSEVVFRAAMAIYERRGVRHTAGEMDACRMRGLVTGRMPSDGSVFRYMESATLTPLLQVMIAESAEPMMALETERQFAIDASGFATHVYGSYCEHRHGVKSERKARRYIKSHVIAGTRTHAVTYVQPTEGYVHDTTQFELLVSKTADRTQIREVSADPAYLSKANAEIAEKYGAVPYISFKINSTGAGPKAMQNMWHRFNADADEWGRHYHRRSNVETVFGMVKDKFGERLRERTLTAQYNAVLLRFLLHNLSCIVHAIHTLKIEPTFDRTFGIAQLDGATAPTEGAHASR